jgi:hypothetical protein
MVNLNGIYHEFRNTYFAENTSSELSKCGNGQTTLNLV